MLNFVSTQAARQEFARIKYSLKLEKILFTSVSDLRMSKQDYESDQAFDSNFRYLTVFSGQYQKNLEV